MFVGCANVVDTTGCVLEGLKKAASVSVVDFCDGVYCGAGGLG